MVPNLTENLLKPCLSLIIYLNVKTRVKEKGIWYVQKKTAYKTIFSY